MSAVLDSTCSSTALHHLVRDITIAVSRQPADIAEAVRQVLAVHGDIELPLSPAQWAGSPERYTRHLLHADPAGRFSVMALIWHPGQRTPVHGHQTWCAYLVLRGMLREARFAWQPSRECAAHTETVTRSAGQTLAAPAGLGAIHSLGNDSDQPAVSIHVYGVRGERIATHVNHLVRGEYR